MRGGETGPSRTGPSGGWLRLLVLAGWLAARLAAAEPGTNRTGVAWPAFLARPGDPVAPAMAAPDGYVGSDSCRECHREEHASWHRSFHRTMTQKMTPGTVLGRFDGSEVTAGGYRYRVFQEGGGYWAEGPDPDQLMYWVQGMKKPPPANLPRLKLPVVMATGSHHYQTYWVPSPRHPGVLQTLPLVYLKEAGRWVPRSEAFLHAPDDPERFVTQWNHHCILCHSTGGNPGLDTGSGALKTQVAELGIACESCHGPGRDHAALRRSLPAGARPEQDPIVNPAKLDAKRSSEVCGQCHGVFLHKDEFGFEFAQKGNLFRPGEVLERTRHYPRHPRPGSPLEAWADLRRNPQFFRERWWPDGQMLAGGREFSAQRESGCYQKGNLSCLSCHSMHDSEPDDQLRRDRTGSEACVECHREPRYTSELAAHTHHAAGSPGSDCRNCHMPHTAYALLKAIRNHQIGSPRVTPPGAGGAPNACNLCHLDRSLAWTQEWLGRWYRQPAVELPAEAGTVSAAAQWLLQGHAAQRIIAAWHFGWGPALRTGGGDWVAPLLAATLADDYGPVRFVAARSLRQQPGWADVAFDFLASPPELRRVADAVVARAESREPAGPGRAERLQKPDGRLDRPLLEALRRKQDRRPVTVKE